MRQSAMQAVGIYSLAGYLWEGRVPYYQAQEESELFRLYAMDENIKLHLSKKRKHQQYIII